MHNIRCKYVGLTKKKARLDPTELTNKILKAGVGEALGEDVALVFFRKRSRKVISKKNQPNKFEEGGRLTVILFRINSRVRIAADSKHTLQCITALQHLSGNFDLNWFCWQQLPKGKNEKPDVLEM
jgi:hypothetical protein